MTWDEGDETGDGPCDCFTCRVLTGTPRRMPLRRLIEWRANIREAIQHGAEPHGTLAERVMPPMEYVERGR